MRTAYPNIISIQLVQKVVPMYRILHQSSGSQPVMPRHTSVPQLDAWCNFSSFDVDVSH